MAVVETRQLTKVFKRGNVGAVNNVDLQSREGEFLVLLGPSGSGKTTLLRMIAGLEEPTAGDILIGGRVVNDLTPRERGIAMVFQSYALYPHLTVYNNIVFPLKAQGVAKAKQKTQAEWAASLLGIQHLFARKPRELSGGERQRVALARGIWREPSLFLLDEPLSNLDAKLRASAREELEQFQKRIGTTAIYVTHDQVEAMAMGDRVAFQFRITHSEYLGAERILYGLIEGGAFNERKAISRIPSTHAEGLDDGTVSTFHVAESDLKFFDQ